MTKPLLILLFTLTATSAHAYNADEDCSTLAQRAHVPSDEVGAYKQWCANFEKQCYQLEAKSANDCGTGGTSEATGQDVTTKAQAALAGGHEGGSSSGLAALATVQDIRGNQMLDCKADSARCNSMKATFEQSKLPQKPVLTCKTFSPESDKWSLNASGKDNICAATDFEIRRIQHEMNTAADQAAALKGVRQAATQDYEDVPDTASEPLTAEQAQDAGTCGMFGCAQAADGNYYRKMRIPKSRTPASN